MKVISSPTRSKVTLSVAGNESTHEYKQEVRKPMVRRTCSNGDAQADILGDVPIDLFVVNKGTPFEEVQPFCLGCLANMRALDIPIRRVQA